MKLDEVLLKDTMGEDGFYNVVIMDSLDSTNTYLKNRYGEFKDQTVLIAKEQTLGRGRLSKTFHSPKDTGLYFTLLLKDPSSKYDPGFMTMTAAVAVADALKHYTKDVSIKWVNDVFIHDKKVCGILTEAIFEENSANPSAILIGIGINVNTRDFPKDIYNQASSMALELNKEFDLNEVLKKVLDRLSNKLRILAFDKNEITLEYERNLKYINEEVRIVNARKVISAVILGVNNKGYLKIKNLENNNTEVLYSGEIIVRDSKKKFSFSLPTNILFGPGALNELGGRKLPGTKALIVITKGASVKRLGYLDRVIKEIERAGLGYITFEEVSPNPTVKEVMTGAEISKFNFCDLVIGLGGGSAIDAAKAIAFMSTNPGHYWEYMVTGKGGRKKQVNDPLPIIAITTTAGTGTEANQVSVVTNEDNLEKLGYFNDSLYPVLSVVDSDLMLSVPPVFTAYQGFDALFHAAESYLNLNSHPMVELFALKAVEYVSKYLPRAVKNGSDEEARYYMSLASTYAGIYMMTLSAHGIEHSLSAFHPNLPHGAGLILISRDYHAHMIEGGGEPQKYINLAKAMGVNDPVSPMDFVHSLSKLMEKCEISGISMQEFGITRDEFLPMAENTFELFSGKLLIDPVKLSMDDVVEILHRSYLRGI